jgi:hypothetical protein
MGWFSVRLLLRMMVMMTFLRIFQKHGNAKHQPPEKDRNEIGGKVRHREDQGLCARFRFGELPTRDFLCPESSLLDGVQEKHARGFAPSGIELPTRDFSVLT